ncbi:MAG: hypothetical protein ACE5G7_03790, partial [Candidatus Hydrothermarchaeaceae archaeon]
INLAKGRGSYKKLSRYKNLYMLLSLSGTANEVLIKGKKEGESSSLQSKKDRPQGSDIRHKPPSSHDMIGFKAMEISWERIIPFSALCHFHNILSWIAGLSMEERGLEGQEE